MTSRTAPRHPSRHQPDAQQLTQCRPVRPQVSREESGLALPGAGPLQGDLRQDGDWQPAGTPGADLLPRPPTRHRRADPVRRRRAPRPTTVRTDRTGTRRIVHGRTQPKADPKGPLPPTFGCSSKPIRGSAEGGARCPQPTSRARYCSSPVLQRVDAGLQVRFRFSFHEVAWW